MPMLHRKSWLVDLAAALLIVVTTFPDVIFGGATISMLDLYNIENPPYLHIADDPTSQDGSEGNWGRPTVSLYPERRKRQVIHGLNDHGGAVRQSEPMHGFMAHIFRNGESPYWNPYSATGSLGPETLVDIKFSPFTLLNALAGGTNKTFHAIILSLYVVCLFALIRTVRLYFGFGTVTAFAVAVVYFLGGYHVAYLNSNVTQTLLYFPVLLLALCWFASRPTMVRWLVAVAANIPVLLTTFLPTTVLVLLSAHAISAGFSMGPARQSEQGWMGRWSNIVALQLSSACHE